MTNVRRALLCASVLLSFSARAIAQPAPPPLTAPVNDFAKVIDADSAAEMDRRIRVLQQATGDVVVVATVPTSQPYADIREYAVRMFENGGRGIGERGKDNGVLVVVAVEDRRVAIEVGYALEEFITDGFAGDTIRQTITPEFRNGRYGAGLLAGTTRLINRIAERRGVSLENVPRESAPPAGSGGGIPIAAILAILLVLWIISRRGGGRRRRRYWGGGPWSGWNSGVGPFGGGLGGGFGGFGGGGFGGFGGGRRGGGGFGGFGGGRSGGGGAAGGW